MNVEPKVSYNGINFNDFVEFSASGKIFLFTDIPENWGSPSIDQNSTNRIGSHGVVHGNNFYNRRTITIQGKIIANTQAERVEMEKQMQKAFSLPRNPINILDGFLPLSYTGEDSITWYGNAKTISAPRFSKESGESWYRDFIVVLEFQKFFLEGIVKNTLGEETTPKTNFSFASPGFSLVKDSFFLYRLPEFTYTLMNNGNYPSALFVIIYGAVTNPRIINDTNGTEFILNISLIAGEQIEIDGENMTVLKINSLGVETDVSSTIDDSSVWIFLESGANAIRVEDDTPEEPSFYCSFSWKDCFLN
jgi:phage-related protein